MTTDDLELERRVFQLRYGGEKPLSRAKVAAELGISPGKVRSIEDKAMLGLVELGRYMDRMRVLCEAINPEIGAEIEQITRKMVLLVALMSGRVRPNLTLEPLEDEPYGALKDVIIQ